MDVIAGATAGPFAAACVVLAFAGASKIRRPVATRPAAAALGLPASPAAVRALGTLEVVSAAAALAIGGVAAAAVAVLYGALALAAWRLLVRSPGTACGCLGAPDTPVTAVHVVVNVGAFFVAALAAANGSPIAAVGSSAWARIAFLALVGCCASLIALVLDALPALNAAMREGGSR
ncbi:MAG TPA: MauE/DoxX family redox-associated membrane protein [Acidimicrobiia bacterium]|nr:MauE/DoxX family redox-associated membrane protein [Acidimicrobiia bacterium]